jgi:hypothetical protein
MLPMQMNCLYLLQFVPVTKQFHFFNVSLLFSNFIVPAVQVCISSGPGRSLGCNFVGYDPTSPYFACSNLTASLYVKQMPNPPAGETCLWFNINKESKVTNPKTDSVTVRLVLTRPTNDFVLPSIRFWSLDQVPINKIVQGNIDAGSQYILLVNAWNGIVLEERRLTRINKLVEQTYPAIIQPFPFTDTGFVPTCGGGTCVNSFEIYMETRKLSYKSEEEFYSTWYSPIVKAGSILAYASTGMTIAILIITNFFGLFLKRLVLKSVSSKQKQRTIESWRELEEK